MTERKTPQDRYAEAKSKRDDAQRDLAYWDGTLRLLEQTYPELRNPIHAPHLISQTRGRYREIFEGDRRLAIADCMLRRGGRGRDIELPQELEREDLIIPTREADQEKHRVAYLKRVRQSLSGNPTWFTHVESGKSEAGEEWHEYEVTELARAKVAERFKE